MTSAGRGGVVTIRAEVEGKGVEHLGDDELLGRTPSCPAAFAEFYRRHERSVLAYLRHRSGNAELAADLAAETFAAALIGAARYRGGREPAVAWLFGIARNKLLHARRRGAVEDRARRRLGMEPLVLDDEMLARVDRLAAGEWATALLAELPAEQARAIRARVIEERSYEQIATAMRCSPSVVRKRVSRGLAAMRAAAEEST
jgi:RNA polymerase sigma factor (sigma-70 family)